MTSQTLRSIPSAFVAPKARSSRDDSLPVRRLTTRQKALWLLRTAGTGLVLTGAFVAAIAVGLVAILSLGGVLSLS
jgi:hypothetical protein